MVDWNNFHAYMPGGYYRQTYPINYRANDEVCDRLIDTIDELIETTEFDIKTYTRIDAVTSYYFSKGLECANKGDVEGMSHNLSRNDKFSKVRKELMQPIVKKIKNDEYLSQ